MSDDAAAGAPRTGATASGEFGIGITTGKYTTCMVVTMLATVPIEIVLTNVLGIEDGRTGSFPGSVLGLAGLLIFLSLWVGLVGATQALLIGRYSGVRTQPRGWRRLLPPYWQYRGERNDRRAFSPLLSHASGAHLSSRQLATVIAAFPVLSLVAIIAVLTAIYVLRLDYVWVIGATAGFGGSLAFFGPLLRTLRLTRATRAELVSDPAAVRLHEANR